MSIRWGVMGTAGIATKVGAAIHNAKGAELRAIASRNLEKAQKWAEDHGAEKSYGSYEALLGDPNIDAVYIPLPPSMHNDWAIRAARAGKHVLCEKPLTMDVAEAVEIAAVCESKGVQLMDGVMWVHHDRTALLKKILTSGEVGELRRVTSAFSFNWGPTVPTQNIRAQKELGGGAIGDLGYYCVRATLWAFDEMPTAVFARARYNHNVDIETSAMMYFSHDRVASMDCAFSMQARSWLELAGTDGSITIDDFVLPANERESWYSIRKGFGKQDSRSVGPCIQEVKMIEDFSALVESGKRDSSLPKVALDTVAVCCAILESAKAGKAVEI